MGGKITHELTYAVLSQLYGIYIDPNIQIDKLHTSAGDIDIVNMDKLIATTLYRHSAVVPLDNVFTVSCKEFNTTEVNNGIYLLTFMLCGMYINATLQMVTDKCGILRYTDGRSFEIAGTKYRVKNSKACNCKPLLLSNSKERLLVHKNNDPLDIKQVRAGIAFDKIDLWDYDTSNSLLAPHLFRLEIDGKLIHNK